MLPASSTAWLGSISFLLASEQNPVFCARPPESPACSHPGRLLGSLVLQSCGAMQATSGQDLTRGEELHGVQGSSSKTRRSCTGGCSLPCPAPLQVSPPGRRRKREKQPRRWGKESPGRREESRGGGGTAGKRLLEPPCPQPCSFHQWELLRCSLLKEDHCPPFLAWQARQGLETAGSHIE